MLWAMVNPECVPLSNYADRWFSLYTSFSIWQNYHWRVTRTMSRPPEARRNGNCVVRRYWYGAFMTFQPFHRRYWPVDKISSRTVLVKFIKMLSTETICDKRHANKSVFMSDQSELEKFRFIIMPKIWTLFFFSIE